MQTHKPAASSRVHLLLAAMMWTVVGALLLTFGAAWSLRNQPAYGRPIVVLAVALGAVKARFVLRPAAGRMIERIRSRGDDRCIGGFLSVRTWLFVLAMAAAGRLMRSELAPRMVVGMLYVWVGTALVLASYYLWRGWYTYERLG